MSTSLSHSEAYPGCDYSLSQLLYAAKRKLQDIVFGGRIIVSMKQVEVDSAEQEASEVLSLVRSLKNSLAPINRVPPEVFSLIPNHYDTHRTDRDLIKSTHVCRQWRELLISSASLWTHLNFTNIDKTRAFIQRSKSSPLDIHVRDLGLETYLDNALSLVSPHVPRLRSLVISANAIPDILHHFRCHAPLLENLNITSLSRNAHSPDIALFGGDLSFLRELHLGGVVTHLPWTNMANLEVFSLVCPPGCKIMVTQILDFFESAPLLYTIGIEGQISESSDAPPERIVPLRHLKTFTIIADRAHSILKHLNIPTGSSLVVWDSFTGGGESPLLDYLEETSSSIKNLSHITAVNLCFGPEGELVQLSGPSGSIRLRAPWDDPETPSEFIMEHRILRSIGPCILSTTRLTISEYAHFDPADAEECPVFQTLSSTNNLQTLVLSSCENLPFVFALDPGKNASKLVLCPNLKEIVLYAWSWDDAEDLVSMAKTRALMGAKLSSIKLTCFEGSEPGTEALKLRDHVTHVEYRVEGAPPEWDYLPDESEGRVWDIVCRSFGS